MNAALAGLTGTASLAQELDSALHRRQRQRQRPRPALTPTCPVGCVPRSRAEKMLVSLRDGRKIIGILRSFDQFANIVLEEAQERVIVGKRFADVPLGLYVIRGENVVLLGTMVRARTLQPSAAPSPCSSASCDWSHRMSRVA